MDLDTQEFIPTLFSVTVDHVLQIMEVKTKVPSSDAI
ncbi:hypothetical protein ABIC55_002589 [Sporosarcina psychrophila]|uniref:Transposase n=1 Tax=Sporosarcina psychrophila TaxID=1476 RepID=A0ABV2K8U8_SPOPS